jgi:hypothetical protein
VQQLCAVLQGCLSSNREERSQAEALLKQVCRPLLQTQLSCSRAPLVVAALQLTTSNPGIHNSVLSAA